MASVYVKGSTLDLTYLHIPKTGGDRIVKWLEGDPANNPCIIIEDERATLLDIRNKYPTNYTFTTVRNPWDRAVAGYLHLKELNSPEVLSYFASIGTNEWPEFKMFIEHIYDIHLPLTVSQNSWINAPIDLIIKIENLETEIQPIKDMRPDYNIPFSSGNIIQYKDFYDNKTKELVAKIWEEDIDRFEYTY